MREETASRAGRLLVDRLPLLALIAVFLLSRPYRGIVGDSILYVGRALAGLDPDGVGRDPMWVLDGQMRFSLFPLLLERLARVADPAAAATAAALAGVIAWVCGSIVLSRALFTRAPLLAIVLACAAFPAGYSAYGSVYFAEPLATPRIFAEAAVLFSLAALVEGRIVAFGVLSLVAVVLHPIMAAAGLATAFVYLCLEDRRWLWFGAAAGAAVVAGAFVGLPTLDRLAIRIDAQWLELLRGPTDSLFLTLWPETAWHSKVIQAATVALGVRVRAGAARRLFIAILTASGAMLALAYVFGDQFPLLLIVQAQPWRATWLLAVAAAMSFAICAGALWKGGWPSRLVLALVVSAWALEGTSFGALLAVFALALEATGFDVERRLSAQAIRLLCLCAPVFVCVKVGVDVWGAMARAAALPLGARPPLYLLLIDVHAFAAPAALAIVGLAAVGDREFRPWFGSWFGVAGRSVAAVAVCLCAALFWRVEWDPYRASLARAGVQEDLVRGMSARPGPVLWLGGNQEAWYWARRPNWAAGIQGNGIVFSRELTMLWFERMGALRDLGWVADGGAVSRRLTRPDPVFPDLDADKLRKFCSRPDAPAWIVAPTQAPFLQAGAFIWRAPAKRFAVDPAGGAPVGVDNYLVAPCASIGG